MRLIFCSIFLALFTTAVAQSWLQSSNDLSPSKISLGNSVDDYPDSKSSNEESDSGAATESSSDSTFRKIMSTVLQAPVNFFRAIGTFLASSPFARLREEMNNLNITYPKTR